VAVAAVAVALALLEVPLLVVGGSVGGRVRGASNHKTVDTTGCVVHGRSLFDDI